MKTCEEGGTLSNDTTQQPIWASHSLTLYLKPRRVHCVSADRGSTKPFQFPTPKPKFRHSQLRCGMPNTILKERNDEFRLNEEKQHQFLKQKMPHTEKRNPHTIFTIWRKPVWSSLGGEIGNEPTLIASTLVELRQAPQLGRFSPPRFRTRSFSTCSTSARRYNPTWVSTWIRIWIN